MNWSNLIDSMKSVVHENGRKLITGHTLQVALQHMIEGLGHYYTFGGYAVPTTAPGIPDGPVFYLASVAGVYVNFGNLRIVRDDGLVALLYSDGTWTKQPLGLSSGGGGGEPSAEIKKLWDAVNAQGEQIGINAGGIADNDARIGELEKASSLANEILVGKPNDRPSMMKNVGDAYIYSENNIATEGQGTKVVDAKYSAFMWTGSEWRKVGYGEETANRYVVLCDKGTAPNTWDKVFQVSGPCILNLGWANGCDTIYAYLEPGTYGRYTFRCSNNDTKRLFKTSNNAIYINTGDPVFASYSSVSLTVISCQGNITCTESSYSNGSNLRAMFLNSDYRIREDSTESLTLMADVMDWTIRTSATATKDEWSDIAGGRRVYTQSAERLTKRNFFYDSISASGDASITFGARTDSREPSSWIDYGLYYFVSKSALNALSVSVTGKSDVHSTFRLEGIQANVAYRIILDSSYSVTIEEAPEANPIVIKFLYDGELTEANENGVIEPKGLNGDVRKLKSDMESLSDVARTGNYGDLEDKPYIPDSFDKQQEMLMLGEKEDTANKVDLLDASAEHYPSCKLLTEELAKKATGGSTPDVTYKVRNTVSKTGYQDFALGRFIVTEYDSSTSSYINPDFCKKVRCRVTYDASGDGSTSVTDMTIVIPGYRGLTLGNTGFSGSGPFIIEGCSGNQRMTGAYNPSNLSVEDVAVYKDFWDSKQSKGYNYIGLRIVNGASGSQSDIDHDITVEFWVLDDMYNNSGSDHPFEWLDEPVLLGNRSDMPSWLYPVNRYLYGDFTLMETTDKKVSYLSDETVKNDTYASAWAAKSYTDEVMQSHKWNTGVYKTIEFDNPTQLQVISLSIYDFKVLVTRSFGSTSALSLPRYDTIPDGTIIEVINANGSTFSVTYTNKGEYTQTKNLDGCIECKIYMRMSGGKWSFYRGESITKIEL